MEAHPFIRLLGAILAGIFILGMVLGSMALAQVDPMLIAQRPTRVIHLPTTTLYPTLSPSTPGAAQTPDVSPTPSDTPTPCAWPADWRPYITQAGDTLTLLAAVARSSVYLLMQGNCLADSDIQPGDVVYLPPAAFTPPTPAPPRCGPPTWWKLVEVQRGDTLYSLAQRHGTTVTAIRWANCLQDDKIIAGQRIFLPPAVVVSPTFTHTPAPTLTPTETATPTETPTVTATPTETATPTMTATPTVTASPTLTATPTLTTTEEPPTPTFTPTVSTTPSPTVSETPSPTPTSTPMLTPTPTATPTPLPTATPTPNG